MAYNQFYASFDFKKQFFCEKLTKKCCVTVIKCLKKIRKHLLKMEYQKRQNFAVSSNLTGKCSKCCACGLR
jgi:hypothetical protein